MTTTRDQILQRSERAFDEHGFAASSVDHLTQAAGVSTRTLYKHVGSKNALIEAVLRERSARFFASVTPASAAELFAQLERWTVEEGARGCFFLRAEADGRGSVEGVPAAVSQYRASLRELVARVVRSELGEHDDLLTDQLLVLVEGATSAASYQGVAAVTAAASAAATLIGARRSAAS